jgi:hypothetical protein
VKGTRVRNRCEGKKTSVLSKAASARTGSEGRPICSARCCPTGSDPIGLVCRQPLTKVTGHSFLKCAYAISFLFVWLSPRGSLLGNGVSTSTGGGNGALSRAEKILSVLNIT